MPKLTAGEVGFVVTGLKGIRDITVGDTLTYAEKPAKKPLSGFKKLKPMVFSSLFPTDSNDFTQLRTALEKLALNDSSLVFETENSQALGLAFDVVF